MSTLKKIDSQSGLAGTNSLSLFDIPPTLVAYNKTTTKELLPISHIDQNGPYVFRLWADNQFVDFSRTWLYLVTQIQKYNTTTSQWEKLSVEGQTGDDRNCGVINNFGNSFVKNIRLNINNVDVFDANDLYHYRSYLHHELAYGSEHRKGLSEVACYYDDKDDRKNILGSYLNKGFQARVKKFREGNVYTMAKLDFDLAHQPNLFINNSNIIFTIYRNSDELLLHTPNYCGQKEIKDPFDPAGTTGTKKIKVYDENDVKTNNTKYRIWVEDIRMYVSTVDVVQSLQNAISKQLETSSCKYTLRRIALRSTYLGKGIREFSFNLFQSVIPRLVVIGFVDADAFQGSKTKSPFKFENANVRTISIEANGNVYPTVPYESIKWNSDSYVRPFVELYQSLGLHEDERSLGITMANFEWSHTFFVFALTSTLMDHQLLEVIRNGTTVVKISFDKEVGETGYQMIAFAEFDSILTVDSSRILSYDSTI
jgi:hypothetical protein